jgi:hypothetical protein
VIQTLRANFQKGGYWQVGLVMAFMLFYTFDLGNISPQLPDEAFALEAPSVIWVVASRPAFLFVFFGVFFVSVRWRQTISVAVSLLSVGVVAFYFTTSLSGAGILLTPLLISEMLLAAGIASALSVFMRSLAGLAMEHALRLLILSSCAGTFVRFAIGISKSTALFWLIVCCAFVVTVMSLLLLPKTTDNESDIAVRSVTSYLAQTASFVSSVLRDYWQPLACAAFVYFVNALAIPLFPVGLGLGIDFAPLHTLDFALLHSLGLFVGNIALWFVWKKLNVLFASDSLLVRLALLVVVAFVPFPLMGQSYIPLLSLIISIPQAAIMTTMFAMCVEVVKERAQQHVAITCLMLFFMDFVMVPATAIGMTMRATPANSTLMLTLAAVVFTSIVAFACLLLKKSATEKDIAKDIEKDRGSRPCPPWW